MIAGGAPCAGNEKLIGGIALHGFEYRTVAAKALDRLIV
jgi:hypothetical protein